MRKKGERNNRTNINIIIIIVFIFIGGTNMNACGFLGIGDSSSWKEEVLLHDGSKIVVERWQKRGGSHEIGQKPGIKEQFITFTLPGTNQVIKWNDEYSEDVGRANLGECGVRFD